ncbi:MAG: hypothetical protein AB7O44_27040 [Hyphomicrobiaceae bacterium]
MFRILLKLAAYASLGAASAAIGSAAAADGDLSGKYAMSGASTRANSPAYSGECTLLLTGEVYVVNCVNEGSGDRYEGKGLRRGGLFSLYLGEYLVVYRIESDGTLVGDWAHTRSDDYGKETLKPKR